MYRYNIITCLWSKYINPNLLEVDEIIHFVHEHRNKVLFSTNIDIFFT